MTNNEAIEILNNVRILDSKVCEALHMAVSALKEDEPRVLSFDEAHGTVEPIVLQIKDNHCLWWVEVTLMDDYFNGTVQSAIRNLYDDSGRIYGRVPEEYGKTWRCWNKRPTDEQRKAVPWEEG